MAPTVQKATVIQQDGSVALREVAVPKPGPDEILVKVVAAAQNPSDSGWEASTISRLLFFPHYFGFLFREARIGGQAGWSSRWVRLFGDRRGDRVERPARSALDRRARRRPGPWRLAILILSQRSSSKHSSNLKS
jgi:hypothetical protein